MARYSGYLALCLMALLLALPTGAMAVRTGDLYERAVDPLTDAFARSTIVWTGAGFSGETLIVYGVEEHEGRIAVCGMYMSEGRYSRDVLMRGLRVSSISSGGYKLITDLRYFDEFSGERDYFRFACRVTKFRWNDAFGKMKPKYEQGFEFFDPPS